MNHLSRDELLLASLEVMHPALQLEIHLALRYDHDFVRGISGIETFIGTICWECLDKFIIFGKRHLDYVISEFVSYYNQTMAHD